MNIFVGNLSFDAKDADVYKLFMPFGSVTYVSIVMDKKGKNSRGFAFLEMPDEAQAQAAITALHRKEFMGRPINVEPSRIKPERSGENRRRESNRPEPEAGAQHYAVDNEGRKEERPGFNPDFIRTGRYRGGRRTLSFLKKRAEAGIKEEYIPAKKNKENPMRWRKHPKPWEKGEGESRRKGQEGFKPWEKKQERPKSWEQKQERPKPWERKQEGSKPWEKGEGESRGKGQGGFKSREKAEGGFRRKDQGGFKPWEKTEGEFKHKRYGESKSWEEKQGRPKSRERTEGEFRRKGQEGFKPWEKAEGESRRKGQEGFRPWHKNTTDRKKPFHFKGRRKAD
ncbi:MAG: RNA-binding protein [Candidatus Omnitrophota bacterium]